MGVMGVFYWSLINFLNYRIYWKERSRIGLFILKGVCVGLLLYFRGNRGEKLLGVKEVVGVRG